jgi:hypothetical protein
MFTFTTAKNSIIIKCLEWQKSQLNTTNCPKRRLKYLWISYLYFDPSLINKTIPEIKQHKKKTFTQTWLTEMWDDGPNSKRT